MKGSSLPFGYLLGALNRMQSAEYVNVCPSVFDEMVADGRMPKPVVVSERRFGWIQRELDAAPRGCRAKLKRRAMLPWEE
jgi:predicted DNA-binding transcriptional regulator AlpA